MSASPKHKAAQPNPTQHKVGGIGVLASPKFSFRAALGQHKAAKLANKATAESSDPAHIFGAASQDSKVSRPARAGNASSIPSLSGRGRFNSTSSDTASTSTLPKKRGVNASPDVSRTLSSLGKRHIEDEGQGMIASSSSVSDFGALIRPKAGTAQSASLSGLPSRSTTKNSKLPGPPSARTLWSSASTKALASPVTNKVPLKIARSDSVAEVHAAAGKTPPLAPSANVRATTTSTLANPMQRPKIGTLPKPKPNLRPRRTLLDEKPLLGFKQGEGSGEEDSSESEEEDADEDEDGLEGPDVSRIRTKKATDTTVKIAAATSGSRIPSAGSTRIASRTGPRSSINGAWPGVGVGEKENIAQMPFTQDKSAKRLSVGLSARARSSLPLAVTQHTPQDRAADINVTQTTPSPAAEPVAAQPIRSEQSAMPPSPSKMSSLSALRTRGESAKASKILPPASHRPDLGIKTSIIQANPVHPAILSIQSKHQPISTPEALIKAKKRLSGALLSSSSSSSAGFSSTERGSTLPRSTSSSTPRSPIKSSLLLPSKEKDGTQQSNPSPASRATPSSAAAIRSRARVMSSSEIDANLLASLKVVAQKAKIDVEQLLDEDQRDKESNARGRGREVSQELLDELAGDVSVDLMALDLAAGSPAGSEASMLRSPVSAMAGLAMDTPESVLISTPQLKVNAGGESKDQGEPVSIVARDEQEEEEDGGDASCPSPSLRAAAARFVPAPQRIIPPSSSVSAFREPQQYDELETPVRRTYRNAASTATTPFPASVSPTKKYPPSAAMSARTRSRLKKALRESLGLEAHFAAVNVDAGSATEQVGKEKDKHMGKEAGKGDGPIGRSVSAMLLTEDDGFLDELVSAVARIGLEDTASTAETGDPNPDAPAPQDDVTSVIVPLSPPAPAEGKTEALEQLETQLAASTARTAILEQQLASALTASSRMDKTQKLLGDELARLRGELAGTEWAKAREGWARARVEALAEMEDFKVEADALLVFKAQLRVWEGLVRAI